MPTFSARAQVLHVSPVFTPHWPHDRYISTPSSEGRLKNLAFSFTVMYSARNLITKEKKKSMY